MCEYDRILFDLDGCLLRGYETPRSVYERAARETLEQIDGPVNPDLQAVLTDPGSGEEIQRVCERHGLDPATTWARRERIATRIANDRLRDGERTPYDDVEALEPLSERADLGIVSNNRHGTVEFVSEYFEFGASVSTAQGRQPTVEGWDRLKPDPHLIRRGIEGLEANAAVRENGSQTLYVGDRESDVVAAHAAGIEAAFLERPHNDTESLEATPEALLQSLADLLETG